MRRPPDVGAYRERPQTLVETILEMRATPLFANVNLDAVVELARHTREARAEPGDVLWSIGDRSTYMLRIGYGHVRCENADGAAATVGPGFALGSLDAFAHNPRSFAARAETRVIASRLDLAPMLGVLEAHPDLALDLISALARMNLP